MYNLNLNRALTVGMDSMDLQLPTPEGFPAFPYNPPYGIQTDLMRHLYKSIEQKKVTIVESPTGTVSAGLGRRKWTMT